MEWNQAGVSCLRLALRIYGPPLFRGGKKRCPWQFSSNGGRARVRLQGFRKPDDREQRWGRIHAPDLWRDGHTLSAFAAAADVNQPASAQAIAMEHRVTQSFPKGELNGLLLSENPAGSSYQSHEPIHRRWDQADLASLPPVEPENG